MNEIEYLKRQIAEEKAKADAEEQVRAQQRQKNKLKKRLIRLKRRRIIRVKKIVGKSIARNARDLVAGAKIVAKEGSERMKKSGYKVQLNPRFFG